MNTSASDTFITGEFGMSWNGRVWHRLYNDDIAICGVKTDPNWAFGQPYPVSSYSEYCKKCMKHSKFRVVVGVIVE